MRGATDLSKAKEYIDFISTHTPREGRDDWMAIQVPKMLNFNSHAP